MIAAVAHEPLSLDEALRALIGSATAGRDRREGAVRCVVCHEPATRERAINGSVIACGSCGSVLEEISERPQLRLI